MTGGGDVNTRRPSRERSSAANSRARTVSACACVLLCTCGDGGEGLRTAGGHHRISQMRGIVYTSTHQQRRLPWQAPGGGGDVSWPCLNAR
eukprot:4527837-Pyramimonas_sp.AAC.2